MMIGLRHGVVAVASRLNALIQSGGGTGPSIPRQPVGMDTVPMPER